MLYLFLKWLHILLAVVALGSNLTYSIWMARARRSPESLAFTLRTIKVLDDRVANPAYGLSLITGLIMVQVGEFPWTTPWIHMALGLYVLVVLIAVLGFTPNLKKQIKLAETAGPKSPEYTAAARTGSVVTGVLLVLVLAMTYLMVFKPVLWM